MAAVEGDGEVESEVVGETAGKVAVEVVAEGAGKGAGVVEGEVEVAGERAGPLRSSRSLSGEALWWRSSGPDERLDQDPLGCLCRAEDSAACRSAPYDSRYLRTARIRRL